MEPRISDTDISRINEELELDDDYLYWLAQFDPEDGDVFLTDAPDVDDMGWAGQSP
jgi:hypothetical protein